MIGDAIYVLGGQQRGLRPLSAVGRDWYEYERAVIARLATFTGEASTVAEYVSPPDARAPDSPAILFKSGTLEGDRLYVCTQTEVLVYRVPEFDQVAYLSLPQFNDLHHVRPTPAGTLLIANTGLDMVLEVTLGGEIVREWDVLDGRPWTRFSRDVDYRRIATTKPHMSHPNYVFIVDDDVWTTRFEQRDAVCLTRPGRRIEIGAERPHDGVLHGGRIYFTTVDGKLVVGDPRRLEILETIDLTSMHEPDTVRGWCRGIMFDGDHVWVGFSRIRPTRFRENVGWVARGFRRDFGTHVACYDLVERRCVKEIRVEPFGLSAIFGIFPATSTANPTGALGIERTSA